MTKKLYAALDIPENSAKDEVKKAYRRKARKHHPDVGGDKASFELVCEAHRVLTDDEKRKRYDDTGDAGNEQSGRNPVADLLGSVFLQVFGQLIQSARDPLKEDVAQFMRNTVQTLIDGCHDERIVLKKNIAVLKKSLGRFKHAGKGGNLLEQIVLTNVQMAEAQLREVDAKEALFKDAWGVLKDYKWERDKAENPFMSGTTLVVFRVPAW